MTCGVEILAPKLLRCDSIVFLAQMTALEAELGRVNEENMRLKEMLASMAAKYSSLRNQMTGPVSDNTSSEGGSVSLGTKRKRDTLDSATTGHDDATEIGKRDHMESTTSDDSCKRIREELKPKVSKLYVRTDPSDTSLVSSADFLMHDSPPFLRVPGEVPS